MKPRTMNGIANAADIIHRLHLQGQTVRKEHLDILDRISARQFGITRTYDKSGARIDFQVNVTGLRPRGIAQAAGGCHSTE
jgi:hypothetical protein